MANCATHPEVEAVGTCARCGQFYCAAERFELDAQVYCGTCAVRPDVDWLGIHFRKYEGKRSGLAWSFGLLGLLLGIVGVASLFAGTLDAKRMFVALGLVLLAGGGLAFFAGRRFGRFAPVAMALPAAGCFALASTQESLPVFLGSGLLLTLFGLSGVTDVRSKLFYRVTVPRPDLRKHFDRYGNNPLAVVSSRIALGSLFVPGLSLVALGLAVFSLTRVNSKATPPVGNVGTAVGAIVFSLFTSMIWGASLLPIVFRRH
jgi:hypothetical protein